MMILSFILTLVFVGAVAVAMVSDLTRFEIPDSVALVLAGGAVVALLADGGGLSRLLIHLAVAAGAFGLGLVLFMLGLWGGGDVKLMAALGLWLGWPLILPYLQLMVLLGGGVGLGLLVFRRLQLPASWLARPWLARLHAPDEGMPYGLALGGAALMMMAQLPGLGLW